MGVGHLVYLEMPLKGFQIVFGYELRIRNDFRGKFPGRSWGALESGVPRKQTRGNMAPTVPLGTGF